MRILKNGIKSFLGVYIIMSALVFIAVKLPLIGIFKICNLYIISPVIAGMSSCLIFIMFKCYNRKGDFECKKLLCVFFLPFIFSSFILVFNSYIGLSPILYWIAFPFSIAITTVVTPEGFSVIELNMDSANPTGSGGASSSNQPAGSGGVSSNAPNAGTTILEVLDMRRDLIKMGGQLNYFIDQMVKVQTVNDIKVFQDSVGYIDLTAPANMSQEEGAKLAKRVRVIATAFEDQCTTYESIIKKGMAKKQEYLSLGGLETSRALGAFDKEASKLNDIKKEYYGKITLTD